jgi:hypothetical protein
MTEEKKFVIKNKSFNVLGQNATKSSTSTFKIKPTEENSIEKLVKQLSDDPANLTAYKNSYKGKLIIIDEKTAEVRPNSRLQNIGRKLKYYLVFTQEVIESSFLCTVKDIPSNHTLDISVTYQASCKLGDEGKLVQMLHKQGYSLKGLNKLLDEWIKAYANNKENSGISFIQNYFRLREEFQEFINRRAYQEAGLKLKIHLALELEKENLLKPFEISSEYFSVRVKDCDEEFKLKLDTELKIDEENKINSILSYSQRSQLESLIKSQVKTFLQENTTLEEFSYELNGRLSNKLIEYLNRLLRRQGRKVSFLSLKSNEKRPPEFLPLNTSVPCTVRDCSVPIRVEHELYMKLDDIGKYKAAKIDKLESWVETQLDQITRIVLFERSYADLIRSFDENDISREIPNEIRRKIEKQAKEIGYCVQHHLVKPQDLEILTLQRDGISFEKQGSFVTYNPNTEVKLNIIVEGKIRKLEKITPYINPNTRIVEEIEKTVVEETKQLLHTIDAERFYMRFSYSDITNEIPVEQQLKMQISEKLERKFGLEDVIVTPKMLETNIAKRFNKLREGHTPFKFEIFSLADRGHGEKVEFELAFKVRSVGKGGWDVFQSNNFQSKEEELGKIREILEHDIKTKLETISSSNLQYGDIKEYPEIKKIVDLSIDKIIQTFGLEIEIIIFKRLPTRTEKITQEKYQIDEEVIKERNNTKIRVEKLSNEALLDELQDLQRKRLSLLRSVDDDDDELIEVNQRIKKIKENPAYSIENAHQQLEQLKSNLPKKLSVDDYKKALSLSEIVQPSEEEFKNNK